MLSFQEQHELVNKIYDYSIDEDTIKAYIIKGNSEEQAYNKSYIMSAFKDKLNLIDFSDEYIKLIKLYINFFIVNNDVYYYNKLKNKIYSLPTRSAIIYDASTDKPIIEYNSKLSKELAFCISPFEYDICNVYDVPFAISYDNPERLKDVDKIIIKDRYTLNTECKESAYLKTLSQALRNDDIDLFADICAQFPDCINNEYRYQNYQNVKLFELTVLFNAIKCFKYMIMNNYYNNTNKDYYTSLIRFVAVSNNFEMIRLLENVGIDIYNNPWTFYSFIDYHRNDIMKYAMLNFPIDNDEIDRCFQKSITTYNYDIMLYILENYDCIRNNSVYYGNSETQYKHMPAILYTIDKYNLKCLTNWLDISTLIKLPFSVDTVVSILKKIPSYICRALDGNAWANISKTCLNACFQYKKPHEYIDKIKDFLNISTKLKTF